MAEEVLKWKLVNFLVADAEVDYHTVSDVYDVVGSGDVDVLGDVLETFKEIHGGLWVGGGLVITPRVVRLSANALNRAVQEGTLDIELPHSMIRKVSVEGGFITKIVRLDTRAGSVKFRCYGAKAVAALIETLIPSRASMSAV
ncbi:hypothetical protein [Pseudomonas sp. MAG733B]|jgi:hypothetical protein|uniref:hypothetical protein n=1 Tax=Pseudomonas sp. MAG733B TaxID=3122079 RepID=UPI0030CD35C2